MTSHAAVVARGMGKCCICGWDDIKEIGIKIFKKRWGKEIFQTF